MIINLIFLLVIIFSLILLSWIWPPDSPWSPWWRTNKKTARAALKLAGVKKGDRVYELGSGEATTLIVAASEFNADCVGIEIEPFRFYLSKYAIMRKQLSNKIKLIRGNFFEEDISDATVVFLYLVPKTLNRLKPKLLKELKPGTRIVSSVYEIPGGLEGRKSKKSLKPKGFIKSIAIVINNKDKELFLYTVPGE